MLVTACCDNYICRLCVRDLQDQEVKDAKFKAVCPFGCQHTDAADASSPAKLKISDIDLTKTIKKYSDSQYGWSQVDATSVKPPVSQLGKMGSIGELEEEKKEVKDLGSSAKKYDYFNDQDMFYQA